MAGKNFCKFFFVVARLKEKATRKTTGVSVTCKLFSKTHLQKFLLSTILPLVDGE